VNPTPQEMYLVRQARSDGQSKASSSRAPGIGFRWRRASRLSATGVRWSPERGSPRCQIPNEGLPYREGILSCSSERSYPDVLVHCPTRAPSSPYGRGESRERKPQPPRRPFSGLRAPWRPWWSKNRTERFGGLNRRETRERSNPRGDDVGGRSEARNDVSGFNPGAGSPGNQQHAVQAPKAVKERQEVKTHGSFKRTSMATSRYVTNSTGGEKPWSRTIFGWPTARGKVSKRGGRLPAMTGFEGSGIADGRSWLQRGNPEEHGQPERDEPQDRQRGATNPQDTRRRKPSRW